MEGDPTPSLIFKKPKDSIFSNQPNFSYFNKSFDDPNDALFQHLNLLKPQFRNGQELEKLVRLSKPLFDPRNQKIVSNSFIDRTNTAPPKIFSTQCVSSLSKNLHESLLKLFEAQQNKTEVDENHLQLYADNRNLLEKERNRMREFVMKYEQCHRAEIYAQTKELDELYDLFYEHSAKRLMESETDMQFVSYSGLPLVRLYKGSCDMNIQIAYTAPLRMDGFIPRSDGVESKNMHSKLDKFIRYYCDALPMIAAMKTKKLQKMLTPADLNHKYILPLDTLLFLLTAGDHPDIPTECLLDIRDEMSGTFTKMFVFQEPLPSRNTGWHTHREVVEQTYAVYRSLSRNNDTNGEAAVKAEAIDATLKENSEKFRAELFEDYLIKLKAKESQETSQLKLNFGTSHWSLTDSEQNCLDIITTFQALPIVAASAEANTMYLRCIKLEYKPQFGCEILSKYELLKAWLLLTLTKIKEVQFLRISAEDFSFQAKETLNVEEAAKQLKENYKVNVSVLTANLYHFLLLFVKVPAGKYLLRYSQKYPDTMMLCAPTIGSTQNSVSLHDLLRTKPTDVAFMMQFQALTISDKICSVMHKYYKIIPCAFQPSQQKRRRGRSAALVVNDRDQILQQVQRNAERREKLAKALANKRKYVKKAIKKSEKKAAKTQAESEQKELEQDMRNDELLFGFK